MSEQQRIGILGGTFDPVHNAHLEMARAAIDYASLDVVLFVVAARPPHKDEGPFASPEDRLAMVEAALECEPKMEASRIELDRPGVSYTVDTLGELRRTHPDAALYLIMGYDAMLDLPNWKDPDAILARARLLVAPRPGEAGQIPEKLAQACDVMPFEPTDLSSTEVRERIAQGRPFEDRVPPPVARYIKAKSLYRA